MNQITPQTEVFSVPVRSPHPVAVWMANRLGRLYGRAIAGDNGAVRIGAPGIDSPAKYGGYVYPQQMFLGWNARAVASGAIKPGMSVGLPGTSAPYSESSTLLEALARTVPAIASGRSQ